MQSSNKASKKPKIAEETMPNVPEISTVAEGMSKPRTSRSSKLKKETSETGPAKHRKISAPEPVLTATLTAISPSPEEIATLAYSYWIARGYTHGSPEEDWLRAERELRIKR
jgi:DUF2934 family protein